MLRAAAVVALCGTVGVALAGGDDATGSTDKDGGGAPSERARRVLVAGAGINGAAVASFVKTIAERCGEVPAALAGAGGVVDDGDDAATARALCPGRVDIVVAEATGRVGGRLRTVDLAPGVSPEVGASVYHAVNRYMAGFAAALGLETTTPYLGGRLGLLVRPGRDMGAAGDSASSPTTADGGEYAFVESKHAKALTIASALWRYGLSPVRAEAAVDDLVARLAKVYTIQQRGRAFDSAEALLDAVGLKELTHTSVTDWLRRNASVADAYTDEIVHALARLNYGQHAHELSALAGGVACKGRGSELFGVKGGNARIVEHLLEAAGAQVIYDTKVHVDGSGCVFAEGAGAASLAAAGPFDAVVLAHPQPATAEGAAAHPYAMHTTHVTFAKGAVNATYFGEGPGATADDMPSVVLTPRDAGGRRNPFPFRSIGRVRGSADIYKIFSDTALTPGDLARMFTHPPTLLYQHPWAAAGGTGAYPLLPPRARGEAEHRFVLDAPADADACAAAHAPPRTVLPGAPRVYNANALEYAVSTLETQTIGAMNTALLVLRDAGLLKDAPPGQRGPSGGASEEVADL